MLAVQSADRESLWSSRLSVFLLLVARVTRGEPFCQGIFFFFCLFLGGEVPERERVTCYPYPLNWGWEEGDPVRAGTRLGPYGLGPQKRRLFTREYYLLLFHFMRVSMLVHHQTMTNPEISDRHSTQI